MDFRKYKKTDQQHIHVHKIRNGAIFMNIKVA